REQPRLSSSVDTRSHYQEGRLFLDHRPGLPPELRSRSPIAARGSGISWPLLSANALSVKERRNYCKLWLSALRASRRLSPASPEVPPPGGAAAPWYCAGATRRRHAQRSNRRSLGAELGADGGCRGRRSELRRGPGLHRTRPRAARG